MGKSHAKRDGPPVTWRVRPDGLVEYRCGECDKALIVSNFLVKGDQFVQATCKWCRKERRFKTR